MTKKVPFTIASIARAIKGVEAAGRFVVGVKPDGSLIVADEPFDVDSLISGQPRKSAEAPTERRFGDYFKSEAAKWEDQRAADHNELPLVSARARPGEMETPRRVHYRPRGRQKGGWGFAATIKDPKMIESYRAEGFAVYEEGELEKLIRKTPMGKRETAALGGFFRARGEPVDVKGARVQITNRLVIRGYIEAAADKHRITPAGKAEWLRLTSTTPADQP